jgi:hypothetical protein
MTVPNTVEEAASPSQELVCALLASPSGSFPRRQLVMELEATTYAYGDAAVSGNFARSLEEGLWLTNSRMSLFFVIATDRKLRTAVWVELRELGIEALGMDSLDEAGRAFARGRMPAAIVLEAMSELVGNPTVPNLVKSVPTILIASGTETMPLPPGAAVLYRPVRIGDIVAKVRELLTRGQAA